MAHRWAPVARPHRRAPALILRPWSAAVPAPRPGSASTSCASWLLVAWSWPQQPVQLRPRPVGGGVRRGLRAVPDLAGGVDRDEGDPAVGVGLSGNGTQG